MVSSIQSSIGVGLGVFYVLVAGAELCGGLVFGPTPIMVVM
jgi:hypothetical protein